MGIPGAELNVVADHQHCCAAAEQDLQDLREHLLEFRIQPFGGLVQEQNFRIQQQHLGQGGPLLLPTGELGREVLGPVCQPHIPQHLARVQWIPANLAGQLHILQGSKILHQIIELKHKAYIIPSVGLQLPLVEG